MVKRFLGKLILMILSTAVCSQDTMRQDSTHILPPKMIVKPLNFSLVYPLCIHKKESKKNNYYFSLNILNGRTNNIRILEIGGLYNLSNDVQFLQIAGIFNKTNHIAGLQLSGLANIAYGEATAIQVAGLLNLVKQESLGIRVAGLGNMLFYNNVGIEIGGVGNISMGEFTGIQIAGLGNYNKQHAIGLQVAGLCNYAQANAMGLQLSMLSNISMGIGAGLQVTGILNLMNNYSGLEIAGIANVSLHHTAGFTFAGITNITKEDFRGIQISLFNYVGHSSHGIQIGLINYADTIAKGFALGLINIIRKGRYSEIEMSTNNSVHLAVNYKSGTKKLYTIYGIGYYFSNRPFIHFGLGLGGKYSFNQYVAFQPEIVSYTYFHPNKIFSYLGNTTQFMLGITYDINQRFSIIAAPSFYVNVDDKKSNPNFEPITSSTKPLLEKISPHHRIALGVGYKIGVAMKL